MSLPSAWIDGTLNADIARNNLKEFVLSMENPNKVATRAQFEEAEKAIKSVVEQRLFA